MNDIYLSGPIRREPNYNLTNFWKTTEYLRSRGSIVTDPLEMDLIDGSACLYDTKKECFYDRCDFAWLKSEGIEPETSLIYMQSCFDPESHKYFMQRDLTALMKCKMVVLLPGYHRSEGCKKEIDLARSVGTPVCTVAQYLEAAQRPYDDCPWIQYFDYENGDI